MDNQLAAPDDCAIDNQLCSRNGWMVQSSRVVGADISSRRKESVRILALQTDDVIQEFAIDFTHGSSLCQNCTVRDK
jgi:hypothetical protein